MHNHTLKQLSSLLQSKQLSATELAQHFLTRIAASQLNAFNHVEPSLTLRQAALADQRLAAGDGVEHVADAALVVRREARAEAEHVFDAFE